MGAGKFLTGFPALKFGNRGKYMTLNRLAQKMLERSSTAFYTVASISAYLEISPCTVRRLIHASELEAEKHGGKWWITKDSAIARKKGLRNEKSN